MDILNLDTMCEEQILEEEEDGEGSDYEDCEGGSAPSQVVQSADGHVAVGMDNANVNISLSSSISSPVMADLDTTMEHMLSPHGTATALIDSTDTSSTNYPELSKIQDNPNPVTDNNAAACNIDNADQPTPSVPVPSKKTKKEKREKKKQLEFWSADFSNNKKKNKKNRNRQEIAAAADGNTPYVTPHGRGGGGTGDKKPIDYSTAGIFDDSYQAESSARTSQLVENTSELTRATTTEQPASNGLSSWYSGNRNNKPVEAIEEPSGFFNEIEDEVDDPILSLVSRNLRQVQPGFSFDNNSQSAAGVGWFNKILTSIPVDMSVITNAAGSSSSGSTSSSGVAASPEAWSHLSLIHI